MHTHHNFFYQSDGHKMDYGGHNSIFESNVVIVRPYDGQNCVNSGGFVAGHQDRIFNNTCQIMDARSSEDVNMVINQGAGGTCSMGPDAIVLYDNKYYTRDGNASVVCGGPYGTTLEVHREAFPEFERGSVWGELRGPEVVIQWARDVLGI